MDLIWRWSRIFWQKHRNKHSLLAGVEELPLQLQSTQHHLWSQAYEDVLLGCKDSWRNHKQSDFGKDPFKSRIVCNQDLPEVCWLRLLTFFYKCEILAFTSLNSLLKNLTPETKKLSSPASKVSYGHNSPDRSLPKSRFTCFGCFNANLTILDHSVNNNIAYSENIYNTFYPLSNTALL